MYDIFLICPVRNANRDQKQKINEYIQSLENKGYSVYYPARDTNQNDKIGYRICEDNRQALYESRFVYLFWDKNSQGSLFDLGMAFYSGKELFVINPNDLEVTEEKSFPNMVSQWDGNTGELWGKYINKEWKER